MARLSANDMRIVEDALGSGSGYVADFSNSTFGSFFRSEVGISIYDDVYASHGKSKGKRLRAFLEEATDDEALKALRALHEYVTVAEWRVGSCLPKEWAAIWTAFEDLIKRLAEPMEFEINAEKVIPWVVKVQKKLRDIHHVAFKAYDDALDIEEKRISEGVKTALETHYAVLKEILPKDFPASKMGDMGRHIHFSDFSDMRSIIGSDVPDVMIKVERYALSVHSSPSQQNVNYNVKSFINEIFLQSVEDTLTSRNPDWHMLVLKCCMILAERFTAMTGLDDDLSSYGRAFSLKAPMLLVPSNLDTETRRSQQQGAMFLFQGYRSFVRNTHAHQLKDGDEAFALQAVVFLSILADVLSAATLVENAEFA